MTLHTTLPNGVVSRVRGVFSYRTDEAGLLLNLRGFWHMGVMTFEQPEGG
jgi:steroid delta-isomerase